MTTQEMPMPGSIEAKEQGCTCPSEDNNEGKGLDHTSHSDDTYYMIAKGCPLHGIAG